MKISETFMSLALLFAITILLAGCGLSRAASIAASSKAGAKVFPCPVTEADAEAILRTRVKQLGQGGHMVNRDSKVTQTSCTYSGVSKDSLNPAEMSAVEVSLAIKVTTTPNAKESFAALKQGPVSPVTGIGDEAAQDSIDRNSDPEELNMGNLHVLKNSTLIEFQVMARTSKGGSSEALRSVAQKVAARY
jgi:hypothetical protein